MSNLVSDKTRYDAINGLRAYSSIGIVLMHVLTNGNYALSGFAFEDLFLSFTNLVFLFMVVSGFSLCCGYFHKIVNNQISVNEFYSKRYAKIWPFFALLSVLDFVISPSKNALYEVFANLTLCFGLLPNADISVIGVGWFLGLVFVFYLVFPFFCYLLSDKKRAWLSFAATLVFHALCSVRFAAGRANIVYSAMFFVAGGMIFLYKEKLQVIAEKYRWILLAATLALVAVYYMVSNSGYVMLMLFSVMLIYALQDSEKAYILCNPFTKFLSGISLEIYLSHMVVFRIIEKLGMTKLFASDLLSYSVTSVGTIVGTIVFSLIIQRLLAYIAKIKNKVEGGRCMRKVKSVFHWLLACCIAFCAVNLICFLYERPTGWINTPNGPSPTGWRPGSVIIHGTEGYGVAKVDSNGYSNPEGQLMPGHVLMMGSSHTQGKEVPSDRKYSVLVNNHFAKSNDLLYTYNISSDGNFLPSLIKHFPAAVEAFPEARIVTMEIANTDFSVNELEDALQQIQYDPQSSIVHQVEQLGFKGKLKNGIKEYFPLLSLMKRNLETKLAVESSSISTKRDNADYQVLLDETMERIRGQFDGNIIFIYHPNVVFNEKGEACIAYSETWLLFQNACREHGVNVIDMGPVFLNHYENARQLPHGFSNTTPGTGHLNKVGHQLIAQTLIEFLEETA